MVEQKKVSSKAELIALEGWEIEGDKVHAYGTTFPLVDPISIHFKVYRTHEEPLVRFHAMRRIHDILWPDQAITYNYWMERMFKEHCGVSSPDGHWKVISLAAGGGAGKTFAAAKIVIIFFLANPQKRAVIVASTTLDSLKSRIFGYVVRDLKRLAVQYPFILENSPPPKVHPKNKDSIHGIYSVSANRGEDEQSIKNWIGRHPEDSLLLVLDEATDLPPAIIKASANLEQGLKGTYQMIAIGNSNDIFDLHGALSTPKVGWDKIDPKTDFMWETSQAGGVCLYFNPYDSPAIHETDPEKKAALSHFLMTEEKLVKAEQELGVDSDQFWRFIMGFWRTRDTTTTLMSEAFLQDFDCTKPAEFSGKYKLQMCAGLDPSFSSGGDKCILRLGVLGHHVNGKMVLDFRGTALIFEIKILVGTGKSAELQIADQVIAICQRYNVPLQVLCVDASGQGRGLADVISLRAGGVVAPTKIYSTNIGSRNIKASDIVISSGHDMWTTGRNFIANQQIFGMDSMAYGQLSNRQVVTSHTGKKVLEKKEAYKKRMGAISNLFGRSPDEADAAMLCLQSAILHFGFHAGQKMEVTRFKNDVDRSYHQVIEKLKQENAQRTTRNVPKANYSKGLNSLLGRRLFS